MRKSVYSCKIIRMKLIYFLILSGVISCSYSYNFLLVVGVGNRSLHSLFVSLAQALSKAGHTVTTVSKFPLSSVTARWTHIQLEDLKDELREVNLFGKQKPLQFFLMFPDFVESVARSLWTNEDIRTLWNTRNKFHAIITPSYLNEVAFPFLINYTGVFATFCTPGVEYFSIGAQGNWLSPAVVPNMIMAYDENMTFLERSLNFASIIITKFILDFYVYPKFQTSIQKYFPNIGDVFRYYEKSSLTLVNTHFALESSVPLLPNQVEVGTITTKDPEPLPEDLQEFIDKSHDAGIIYFSLGSFARSSDIPEKPKKILIEVFRKLPQNILWKYEGDDLDLPRNVLVRKWLPQQDILGDPKTRLFISHCGNLGTQEAKYHGVPILALPVTFDQPRNAARLVRKGYGLMLSWETMTLQTTTEAINELINNTVYKERLNKVRALLHDQESSPGKRAVWWLEYVIRHQGAPHLQYAGKRIHFLQYIMADVILCWSVVTVVLLIVVKRIFQGAVHLISYSFGGKNSKYKNE